MGVYCMQTHETDGCIFEVGLMNNTAFSRAAWPLFLEFLPSAGSFFRLRGCRSTTVLGVHWLSIVCWCCNVVTVLFVPLRANNEWLMRPTSPMYRLLWHLTGTSVWLNQTLVHTASVNEFMFFILSFISVIVIRFRLKLLELKCRLRARVSCNNLKI